MPSITEHPYYQIFASHQTRALKQREESYKERLKRLKKLEEWIYANRPSIHKALYADFSKSQEEVDLTEIYPVLSEIRKIKRQLKYWVRVTTVSNPLTFWGTRSEIYPEPKGTSLIISPWNYPFQLSVAPALSSIAAGNTVILKPSEFTPNTSQLLSRMAEEVFDTDFFTVFEGDHQVSGKLLELPFDHIFFTGSPRVGKVVMEAAAKNLTSVTLELGGKSPAIIDETAEITDAAEKIAWGKWLNAGQTCIAPDYVYCHSSRLDTFVTAIKKAVEKLYTDHKNYTGIVSDKHLSRFTSALDQDMKQGAQLIMGNQQPNKNILTPTILTNLPEGSMFLREEIFGPILPILPYDDITEILTEIKQRPKPLAMYHFSKNDGKMNAVKKSISSGMMCFNDCVIQFVHPELPIGGVNNSGIGKAHGKRGFLAFSNEKAVVYQRRGFTMAKTLYPPFDNLKRLTLNLLMKYF
jgi:aldehyde dehydrogenase (NAD+)